MSNGILMADLKRWTRKDSQIDPDNFNCRFYKECNASLSLQNRLGGGETCFMSYVGRQFGVDDAFRLVIVGIDHGDLGRGNFEDIRKGIEEFGDGKPFNPHYKGVVRTAAAIFGSTGAYCGEKCKTTCQRLPGPSLACVINRIAQPNLVKCKPAHTRNRTSQATGTMKRNCAHHLLEELKILRPKLVVFHGVDAMWCVPEAIKPDRLIPVDDITDQLGRRVLHEWQALGAHLLFLCHPSRGCLNRQWDSVVVLALCYLRREKLIPS